jgi:glycosyltransferase involved in cell wall biosynthesis
MKKKTILYFCPNLTTFIQRDIHILSEDFYVKAFDLKQSGKLLLIPRLILQFFYILANIRRARIFICHFAGYSSLLPALLGKLTKIPCLIIVAGTDTALIRPFRYGNFFKKINGLVTAISLRNATHILPVHESLVYQKYSYDEAGQPSQGYTVFAKETKKIPFTPVYYGYDATVFKPAEEVERKLSSFITVGNLSQKTLFIRKGYDLILELARRRTDLNFTLVGKDEKTILDVPENVSLLPYMSQTELIQAFSEHEFYFQLSLMEGFPNALCEAMLCGCIPVGSNVSGIPFIIGDSGGVLQKRDILKLEELVENMMKLSKEDRKKLSIAARNRIAEKFTYHNRKQKLLQLIEKYT